jgi:hypothetical protein
MAPHERQLSSGTKIHREFSLSARFARSRADKPLWLECYVRSMPVRLRKARAMQNDSQTTYKCVTIVLPRFDFEVLRLYRGTTFANYFHLVLADARIDAGNEMISSKTSSSRQSLVTLTEGSFRLLSILTAIKLATVIAAIAQVAFLGPLNALLFLFPASKLT